MKKTIKRIFALFMSLLLLPSALAGVTSLTAAATDPTEVTPIIDIDLEKDFVPGELMIVLREAYLGDNLSEVLPEISIASYEDMYASVIDELGEDNIGENMLDGTGTMFTVTLSEATEEAVVDALEALEDNQNLLSASPNYLSAPTSTTPNDPSYSSQWALPKIKAPEVWDEITDSTVRIAVIDSGIWDYHTDLSDNINMDLAYNAFTGELGNVDDDTGHGTHVAGIIAAQGNNNKGVSGVAWNAEIVPIRIAGPSGDQSSAASQVRAILYALALDIKVANMSYGLRFSYSLLHALTAFSKNGGIIVIAAGNGGTDRVPDNNDSNADYWMCSFIDGVMFVGASDPNDNPATFSNYGTTTVDIFAPGVDIYSTLPRWQYTDSLYGDDDGTSMAAPFVTGAVALLMSKYPNLSAQTIKNAIIENADYVPALDGKCVANGRLNIKATMDALESESEAYGAPQGFSISISSSVENGSIIPSVTTAVADIFVALTANPNPGYWLKPDTLAYNGIVIDQEIYDGYVYDPSVGHDVYDAEGESPESDGDGFLYQNCWYFKMPSSSVVITAIFYMIGDVDLDGSVTVSDSLAVLRHVSGAAVLTGDALIAADVDGDGEVTSDDATIITQYSTGEITVFPIEV